MAVPVDVNFKLDFACDVGTNSIYVLEQFRMAPEFNFDPLGFAALYSSAAHSACDWRTVLIADAVTGETGVFMQLFRVPAPFDSEKTARLLSDKRDFVQFFDKLSSFRRDFLCPLPYDPGLVFAKPEDRDRPLTNFLAALSSSEDTPPNIVLVDEFGVLPKSLPQLVAAKTAFFVPKVTDEFGWALLAAGTRLTGAADEVVQIWMLPEANRLVHTMRAMTQALEYRKQILPVITHERQEFFEPRAAL